MSKSQIYVAIIILGILGLYGLYQKEYQIVVGCVTGISALGMKILEK